MATKSAGRPEDGFQLEPEAQAGSTQMEERAAAMARALNRAVSRVEDAKAELRKAQQEERKLRAEAGRREA